MELVQENVIVTANNFNVTLLTQLWLVENEIILRNEFTGSTLFSPSMVQVETEGFNFLAIPPQIQFEPKGAEEQKQPLISQRLGRLIRELPHTPYGGIGVNFTWFYQPRQNQTIEGIGRQSFFRHDTPFARFFDSPDAKFGAYYSKNELCFRLKLNVGPVLIQRPGQAREEVFQLAFNYHREGDRIEDIIEAIDHWNDAKRNSIDMVNEIERAL